MIHPSAIIEKGVELGEGVQVGPYSYIRSGARIGRGTIIHSHVNIWGQTTIGEENQIFPFCMIGAPPQIIGNDDSQGETYIGNKNIIREGVQIHRGSKKENLLTSLGDENYLMTTVHIAHDCRIGNKNIIASKTGFAGHVKVDDCAIISGNCGVSQHVHIGSYTFCAGMSRFEKDLPPFMCAKEFSTVTSPNLVGMKRFGFTEEDTRIAKEIYKALFVESGLYRDQLKGLETRFAGQKVFDVFKKFCDATKVGIIRNA